MLKKGFVVKRAPFIITFPYLTMKINKQKIIHDLKLFLLATYIFAAIGSSSVAIKSGIDYYVICGIANLVGNLYNMFTIGHELIYLKGIKKNKTDD